jgi:hypothetical protein
MHPKGEVTNRLEDCSLRIVGEFRNLDLIEYNSEHDLIIKEKARRLRPADSPGPVSSRPIDL